MNLRDEKFLITQSLLSAYEWIFKVDNGYEGFLRTLNRQGIQQNQAMLDGIQFENIVNARVTGAEPLPKHKWFKGTEAVYGAVKGAALQVKLSREIHIGNYTFVLYGILDALHAGHIYDIKFSKTYSRGKYRDSPQHPMYFLLCPAAIDFTYLVSDGADLYRETYYPEDDNDIETRIRALLRFLEREKLTDVFHHNWISKY
jgi:hypothetical protein